MRVTRDGHEEDRNGRVGSTSEVGSVGSRRAMLGAAAGGFALAASGLLLPEWLVEDAAADNHPVRRIQHRKEQHRQKHRHQLQHRRKVHRNREGGDQNGNLGNKLRSGLAFYIYDDRSSAAVVDSYIYYSDGGLFDPDTWHKVGSETLQQGGPLWVHTSHQEMAVLIDGRFWIMANNPFVGWPEIYFRHDGSVKPNSFVGYVGTSAIAGMGFAIGIGPVTRTIDGRHFSFIRDKDGTYDAQNLIVFTIRLS